MIKHLVLSGGGPAGLVTYGAARELAKQSFWDIKNIESIYGTSIGSYIAIVLSLGYDWKWLDDFFIKRPWEKVFSIEPSMVINMYMNKGIFGEEFIENALLPLLMAKGLTVDVTLKELNTYNGIDIFMYTTEINGKSLSKVELSHESFPSLTVIRAISMSCAYPFVFKPVCENGKCYIDGGLLNNYPLYDCLAKDNDIDETLSFKNIWVVPKSSIDTESNIVDFFTLILRKMKLNIETGTPNANIRNTVRCLIEDINGIDTWMRALETCSERQKFIERGSNQAKIFLEYLQS